MHANSLRQRLRKTGIHERIQLLKDPKFPTSRQSRNNSSHSCRRADLDRPTQAHLQLVGTFCFREQLLTTFVAIVTSRGDRVSRCLELSLSISHQHSLFHEWHRRQSMGPSLPAHGKIPSPRRRCNVGLDGFGLDGVGLDGVGPDGAAIHEGRRLPGLAAVAHSFARGGVLWKFVSFSWMGILLGFDRSQLTW